MERTDHGTNFCNEWGAWRKKSNKLLIFMILVVAKKKMNTFHWFYICSTSGIQATHFRHHHRMRDIANMV